MFLSQGVLILFANMSILRFLHTERKRRRKRKFSFMFAVVEPFCFRSRFNLVWIGFYSAKTFWLIKAITKGPSTWNESETKFNLLFILQSGKDLTNVSLSLSLSVNGPFDRQLLKQNVRSEIRTLITRWGPFCFIVIKDKSLSQMADSKQANWILGGEGGRGGG